MTSRGVHKTKNVRRRPKLERLDFEFLTTLKGTPWNPNPPAGEMAADAHSTDMAVPMPAPAPVPPVVMAETWWLQHELSWMQISGDGATKRAHTEECRRRLEKCCAEDEKTRIRSKAATHPVDGWLAGRVESAEKATRSGEERQAAQRPQLPQDVRRQQLQHVAQEQQQLIHIKVTQFQIMVSRG